MDIRFRPDLFLTVFASFAILATHMTGQNPALSGADLGDADVRRVVLRGAGLLDLEIVPDVGVPEDG